jgi:hypothetical protein
MFHSSSYVSFVQDAFDGDMEVYLNQLKGNDYEKY